MSDEWESLERAVLDKEWQRRVLDYMILAASLDKEFAQTLCRKVATFASDDRKLTETVESGLKLKQGGKRNPIPGWWPPYLLLHYAGFMRQGEGDYEECNRAAIGRLIEIFEGVTGRRIAPKTMHDQISKAIRTVPRAELDDWVRVQIDARTAHRF